MDGALVAVAIIVLIGFVIITLLGIRGSSNSIELKEDGFGLQLVDDTSFYFEDYVRRHIRWSRRTFGEPGGFDTQRVVNHIQKELREIIDSPNDPQEWADLIILAIDGAWRNGVSPQTLRQWLEFKQAKNMTRRWNIPIDPTQPIEHDRKEESADAQ